MSLAAAGLYAEKWTTRIEQEWTLSLERQRPDLVGRLTSQRDPMRQAVAIAGYADCIVTSNRNDFPEGVLRSYGLEALDPDTFIINQRDLDPVRVITAFKHMRARRRKPASNAEEFAYAIEIGGLPVTAERLRGAGELI